MSAVADKLREAKALIETSFTGGAWARDANGLSVDPDADEAVCWCSMGALAKALNVHFSVVEDTSELKTLERAMGQWPASFNDKHSQEEVLAAFDKAILLAEQEDAR